MDEADRTQEIDEVYQNAAMRSHQARRSAGAHILTSVTHHCVDCEKTIPKERMKANPAAIRCLKCQNKFECSSGHERGGTT